MYERVRDFILPSKSSDYTNYYGTIATDGTSVGVWKQKDSVLWQLSFMNEELSGECIACSIVEKRILAWILYKNGKIVSKVDITQGVEGIMDDTNTGERWEGTILNGLQTGWGVYYNGFNQKIYEGFRIRGVNTIWGRLYHPGTDDCVLYEGMLYCGMYQGEGRQSDRNGTLLFSGIWFNGSYEYNCRAENADMLHSLIEDIDIREDASIQLLTAIDFSLMKQLKRFVCEDGGIVHLPSLSLCNMPELRELDIKGHQLQDCPTCIIKHCPSLLSITVGTNVFEKAQKVSLMNLQSLKRISFGSYAFCGDIDSKEKDVYTNTLTMIDLPVLETLLFGNTMFQFEYIGCVYMKNLPLLKHFDEANSYRFSHVTSIEATNADAFEDYLKRKRIEAR